jgi:1-acyl-sn-glycerol-3-phosphate acyltransferase
MLTRQFYEFIFMNRSWAADRSSLTRAFTRLGQHAKKGKGLWLLIFPEGTITSDEERAKSARYAEREGVVSWVFPEAEGMGMEGADSRESHGTSAGLCQRPSSPVDGVVVRVEDTDARGQGLEAVGCDDRLSWRS